MKDLASSSEYDVEICFSFRKFLLGERKITHYFYCFVFLFFASVRNWKSSQLTGYLSLLAFYYIQLT